MNTEILETIQAITAASSENGDLWTYTIKSIAGDPYLTRTLLPRVAGRRPVLHRIHRADNERHLHNHPWATATFRILAGGYTEERLVDGAIVERVLRPGDENDLTASTFHRVRDVLPGTWTFGLLGERTQDWGFLVDGVFVPHKEYFIAAGYVSVDGKS